MVNTLHLRRDQTELYKLSVGRPNIMHFVRQVERTDDFSVLSRMLIPDRRALWTIPKATIFVDSIDKGHEIARYLRACIRKRFSKDDTEMAIKPFSANLESGTRETFMQYFTAGGMFEGTNYAAECLHLAASLKHIWKPQCKQAWLDYCLISPDSRSV